jgi:hypothetical protein
VANEALVDAIKQIMALAKTGDVDGANARYADLFASETFAGYSTEDQRQALKILILAKRKGPVSPSLIETHRAAIAPLAKLVEAHGAASDYEMLGICYQLTGQEADAAAMFRAGLDLERAQDPESDLCGRLMKRFSEL